MSSSFKKYKGLLQPPSWYINDHRKIALIGGIITAIFALLGILLKIGVLGKEAIIYHGLSWLLAVCMAFISLLPFIVSVIISSHSQKIDILKKRHQSLKIFMGITALLTILVGFAFMFTFALADRTNKLLGLIFVVLLVLTVSLLFFHQMLQVFLDFHKPVGNAS